jgi:hypothetical protein
MATRVQVEAQVHRIIDDVLAGRPVEDDHVELKAEWPKDFRRAARQIAAHANAAAQHPVMWIIGVDEKAGRLTGAAAAVDPANWFAQLESHFADRWAPQIHVVVVRRDDLNIVVLLFETDGVPFLVSAEPDLLEVPWRSATRVRSAKRHELLSIMADAVRHPQADVLDVAVTAQANRVVPPDEVIAHTFSAQIHVYLTPRTAATVYLPLHQSFVTFHMDGKADALELGPARARILAEQGEEIDVRERQVAVLSPVFATFYTSTQLPVKTIDYVAGTIRCRLAVAGSPQPLLMQGRVEPAARRSTPDFKWWLPPGAPEAGAA